MKSVAEHIVTADALHLNRFCNFAEIFLSYCCLLVNFLGQSFFIISFFCFGTFMSARKFQIAVDYIKNKQELIVAPRQRNVKVEKYFTHSMG